MTPYTYTLKSEGLLESILTPVAICQSVYFSEKHNLPTSDIEVTALWDTGAEGSCISVGLAQRLGLLCVHRGITIGIDGPKNSGFYMVDIHLPNKMRVKNQLVPDFKDNGKFDVVIGMDIITLGDFSITNFGQKSVFRFSFPPAEIVEGS